MPEQRRYPFPYQKELPVNPNHPVAPYAETLQSAGVLHPDIERLVSGISPDVKIPLFLPKEIKPKPDLGL